MLYVHKCSIGQFTRNVRVCVSVNFSTASMQTEMRLRFINVMWNIDVNIQY